MNSFLMLQTINNDSAERTIFLLKPGNFSFVINFAMVLFPFFAEHTKIIGERKRKENLLYIYQAPNV
jgi:hypothetical protein